MVGASVSVSGRMPFLSRVCLAFSICQWLCVSLSLSVPPCVCVCVQLCVLAHVSVSPSPSLSLSLNLRLFLALFPDTGPPIPSSAPGLS